MKDLTRRLFVDFQQMEAFAREPLIIERGEGIKLWDVDGKEYLDGLSGVFVANIGYGVREVAQAVADQVFKLPFSASTMATNPLALELTGLLLEITGGRYGAVKLLSGGSEATEAAIKMARQYFRQTGREQKYKVLSHYRGYHGGTGNALAASGWAGWKNPFEPFNTGFIHLHTPVTYRPPFEVPPDKLASTYLRLVEETIQLEGPHTVAAIITEPVMMSAGIVVPPDGYLAGLRELCDRYDLLLIYDEIITGFGRTGKLFAAEHSGAWPDILCLGKGMSGGYQPLSATIITEQMARAFWGEADQGVQYWGGHTYGGNPVAAAAGLAAIRYLIAHDLPGNALRVGEHLRHRLWELYDRHPIIGDVRGVGFLQGIEFVADRASKRPFPDSLQVGVRVRQEARRRGLLLRASPWFVAVAPPLVATPAEIDEIVGILDQALGAVEAGVEPAVAGV